MPQATDEQRQEWNEEKAVGLLRKNGWKLTDAWTWTKPTPDHEPTVTELSAIYFMIDEWDYGGIEP